LAILFVEHFFTVSGRNCLLGLGNIFNGWKNSRKKQRFLQLTVLLVIFLRFQTVTGKRGPLINIFIFYLAG
jgi:hypothetical protein